MELGVNTRITEGTVPLNRWVRRYVLWMHYCEFKGLHSAYIFMSVTLLKLVKVKFFLARFQLQSTKRDMPDVNSLFTIQPNKGSLAPNDRASHIYIIFRSSISTHIKDEPILRCQVRSNSCFQVIPTPCISVFFASCIFQSSRCPGNMQIKIC